MTGTGRLYRCTACHRQTTPTFLDLFHPLMYSLWRSIEQNVLITNITFFFKLSRVIRVIVGIFGRPKSQFWGYKTINIRVKLIKNRLTGDRTNRCKDKTSHEQIVAGTNNFGQNVAMFYDAIYLCIGK